MIKLVYADYKWVLTIDGKQVPNENIIYDGLKMRNDDPPTVEICLDQIEVNGAEAEVVSNLKELLDSQNEQVA